MFVHNLEKNQKKVGNFKYQKTTQKQSNYFENYIKLLHHKILKKK